MKRYIVYDNTGRILRCGTCADKDFDRQAMLEESIMEGTAGDRRQKIVRGKIVNKTAAEIDRDKPKFPQSESKILTQEEWNNILKRLTALER